MISVCDITDDLYSQHEADLRMEHKDFVCSELGSQKDFMEYFVVCPVELQGINNMLVFPILSPYLNTIVDHGHVSVTMIMPSSPVMALMV